MQLLNREATLSRTNERSLVVVIADSNLSIRRLVEDEIKQDGHVIISCGNCDEIDQALSLNIPDVLIFGTLTEISYLESYRKYATQIGDLPIILLTHEPNINKFFRDWAITKGVYDVLSSSSHHLVILRDKLQEIIHALPQNIELVDAEVTEGSTLASEPIISTLIQTEVLQVISYQEALSALSQITDLSKKYFGEMVLGNYWKKALSKLVSEHPCLECWSVQYNGMISYCIESIPDEDLNAEQYQSLKLWVRGFIKECDRIIGDYIEILQESNLPFPAKHIISPD